MIEDFKRLKKETSWRECFAYQDDGSKELDEDKVRAFLDTAFDELLALVEREVSLGTCPYSFTDKNRTDMYCDSWVMAGHKLTEAFARLRGEDNDKGV